MRVLSLWVLASVTIVAAAVVVPAMAQRPEIAGDSSAHSDMPMDHAGRGMMGHRMMRGGMMASGCMGMMQGRAGGDGRPNSQWRTDPQAGAEPD